MTVEGERAEDYPKVFTKIHLHYHFYGDLKPDKVERAIELSLEKYCSATAMLEKTAAVTSSYTINE